jgi:hypothetical protein
MRDTKEIVLEVLGEWSESQINISSESARVILADAITEEMNKHIRDIIESIIMAESHSTNN